jgi:hypothetical protein
MKWVQHSLASTLRFRNDGNAARSSEALPRVLRAMLLIRHHHQRRQPGDGRQERERGRKIEEPGIVCHYLAFARVHVNPDELELKRAVEHETCEILADSRKSLIS